MEQGLPKGAGIVSARWERSDFKVTATRLAVRDPWATGLSRPASVRPANEDLPVRDYWLPRIPANASGGRLERFVAKVGTTRLPEQGELRDPWAFGISPLPLETIDTNGYDWARDGGRMSFYDPVLAENPFAYPVLHEANDAFAAETGPQRRARWMAQLIGGTQGDMEQRQDFFLGVFLLHPEVRSFSILAGLVASDVPAAALIAGANFRLLWDETPLWWSRRRGDEGLSFITESGRRQLGWARAVRIAELAGAEPADSIGADWFAAWLALPSDDRLRFSFLDYAEARLMAEADTEIVLPDFEADPITPLSLDQWRQWGVVEPGSRSRTGSLVRGFFDEIGFTDPLEHRHWSRA